MNLCFLRLIPKIGEKLYFNVWNKIFQKKNDILQTNGDKKASLYYKDYGETYWIFPFNFYPFYTPPKSVPTLKCDTDCPILKLVDSI